MATAVMTLTDEPNGNVNVVVSFGDDGFCKESVAHLTMLQAMQALRVGDGKEEDFE